MTGMRRVSGGRRGYTRWDDPSEQESEERKVVIGEGRRPYQEHKEAVSEEEVDFSVDPNELVYIGEEVADAQADLSESAELVYSGEEEVADAQADRPGSCVNAVTAPSGVTESLATSVAVHLGKHEEVEEQTAEGKSGKAKICQVCGKKVKRRQRHMLAAHLPWFFSPDTACWKCGVECGTLSKLLHHRVLHGCEGIEWPLDQWIGNMVQLLTDLAVMVGCRVEHIHLKVPSIPVEISPLREVLLGMVEEAQGRTVGELSLFPASCPSVVLTGILMGPLLGGLTEEQQQSIVSRKFREELAFQPGPVAVVDAHCHLRQTRKAEPGWRRAGWKEVGNSVKGIDLVVNNCVFPGDWEEVAHANDDFRVIRTVGVHPRLAGEDVAWDRVVALIRSEGCAAIGECGLDETATGMTAQEHLLKKQALLAKETGKPLILHVRGKTKSTTHQLFQRVLNMLQEIGLDRKHRVHLHCFMGSVEDLQEWRSAFSHLLVSISWKSTEAENFGEIGRLVPFGSLAMETDSPHLSPVPRRTNRPQWVVYQAERVAKARNLPVAVILRRSGLNTWRFYTGV